ncbi:MAG: hypothetical protein M3O30_12630 [Planctomycetota bacterium]|nr:hypothetical protein [Planctomycetota bacterium]
MPTHRSGRSVSPALVGLFAWIVPGGGYFLLGHRSRGITIGISIVALFMAGILVGGIRVMDPPGWGQYGYMTQIVLHPITDDRFEVIRIEPVSAEQESHPTKSLRDHVPGSALMTQPLSELGNKPWFVGQILCGPVTLLASSVAVHEAHPTEEASSASLVGGGNKPVEGIPASHSRSWEIGALYTAVAGMLNLLAMIDSSFRAGQPLKETQPHAPAQGGA